MLEVKDQEYLDGVRAFADTLGVEARAQLEEKLAYLAKYRNDTCVCELYRDHAPQSFYFVLYGPENKEGERERWMNGGLIYYGPNDSGVGAPQYSVSFGGGSGPRWEVHT